MARAELKRKVDGVMLSDRSISWTGWQPAANVPIIHTVNGVPYQDPHGVLYWVATVRFRFSNKFSGSTRANFESVVRAWRRKQDLTYKDVYGDTSDVRVHEMGLPEYRTDIKSDERFEVEITLRKLAYEA